MLHSLHFAYTPECHSPLAAGINLAEDLPTDGAHAKCKAKGKAKAKAKAVASDKVLPQPILDDAAFKVGVPGVPSHDDESERHQLQPICISLGSCLLHPTTNMQQCIYISTWKA